MACCSCFQEDVEHSKCMSQTGQEVLAAEQAEVDINALRPEKGAKRDTTVGSVTRPLVLPRSIAKPHKHFLECVISPPNLASYVFGTAMTKVHRLFHGHS